MAAEAQANEELNAKGHDSGGIRRQLICTPLVPLAARNAASGKAAGNSCHGPNRHQDKAKPAKAKETNRKLDRGKVGNGVHNARC